MFSEEVSNEKIFPMSFEMPKIKQQNWFISSNPFREQQSYMFAAEKEQSKLQMHYKKQAFLPIIFMPAYRTKKKITSKMHGNKISFE